MSTTTVTTKGVKTITYAVNTKIMEYAMYDHENNGSPTYGLDDAYKKAIIDAGYEFESYRAAMEKVGRIYIMAYDEDLPEDKQDAHMLNEDNVKLWEEADISEFQNDKAKDGWGDFNEQCSMCGKKLGKNQSWIHYLTSGNITTAPTEYDVINSQGFFPVGSECAKKLGPYAHSPFRA